jgi:hypothetical protein
MQFRRKASADGRLQSLARKIEAVVEQDQELIRQAKEYALLRRRGAGELHALCHELVEAINRHLASPRVELSPPDFPEEVYRDDGANVFQINVSGRIVQVEFHATTTPLSTEKLPAPYILEGSVRAFNQEFLDLSLVPEQPLFCSVRESLLEWVWYDPRSQRTAPFGQDRLLALLERLM